MFTSVGNLELKVLKQSRNGRLILWLEGESTAAKNGGEIKEVEIFGFEQNA